MNGGLATLRLVYIMPRVYRPRECVCVLDTGSTTGVVRGVVAGHNGGGVWLPHHTPPFPETILIMKSYEKLCAKMRVNN